MKEQSAPISPAELAEMKRSALEEKAIGSYDTAWDTELRLIAEIERLTNVVCSGACLLKLKHIQEDPHIRELLNSTAG